MKTCTSTCHASISQILQSQTFTFNRILPHIANLNAMLSPSAVQPVPTLAESTRQPYADISGTAFDQLVNRIKKILGANLDLKSEDVDPDELQQLMREYRSCRAEWEKYSFIDLSRNYTRNLVDNLNGNANLVSRK